MKAVLVNSPGDASHLNIGEYPTPQPNDNELLIKVHATSLNRADILQRQGNYPPPAGSSPILGLDVAGSVEEIGGKVTAWKKGDRVFGLLAGGGYAEYAILHSDMAMRIPETLTWEDAAAIPEVFLTAYQSLILLGNLAQGETVLIHAGASGVGTAAIQIARETGAQAIVTAGSEEKLESCLSMGASTAINYKNGPFQQAVLAATDNRGVNLLLDFVGSPYWQQNLAVLATDGRMVFLAMMGGSKVENFDLRIFMAKRLKIMGSTLRSRSPEYKIDLTRHFARFALPRFAAGSLKPVIDRTFPWESVAEAHRYMEENRNIGKIVLKVAD